MSSAQKPENGEGREAKGCFSNKNNPPFQNFASAGPGPPPAPPTGADDWAGTLGLSTCQCTASSGVFASFVTDYAQGSATPQKEDVTLGPPRHVVRRDDRSSPERACGLSGHPPTTLAGFCSVQALCYRPQLRLEAAAVLGTSCWEGAMRGQRRSSRCSTQRQPPMNLKISKMQ